MKKVSILLIATLMIGLFASAASASGFIGLGIGLQPSVTNNEDTSPGVRIIGNVGGDYEITDKITIDGNVYVLYFKPEKEGTKTFPAEWGVHALLSGKYDLFKVGAGVIGPELTVMYSNGFLPDKTGKYDKSFSVRGGVFVDYPLSDVGSIYGSVSTGLINSTDFKAEGTDYSAYKEFGAKVGLKFKVTEAFSIRTELDYSLASKSTLFSLKFGYNF